MSESRSIYSPPYELKMDHSPWVRKVVCITFPVAWVRIAWTGRRALTCSHCLDCSFNSRSCWKTQFSSIITIDLWEFLGEPSQVSTRTHWFVFCVSCLLQSKILELTWHISWWVEDPSWESFGLKQEKVPTELTVELKSTSDQLPLHPSLCQFVPLCSFGFRSTWKVNHRCPWRICTSIQCFSQTGRGCPLHAAVMAFFVWCIVHCICTQNFPQILCWSNNGISFTLFMPQLLHRDQMTTHWDTTLSQCQNILVTVNLLMEEHFPSLSETTNTWGSFVGLGDNRCPLPQLMPQ